jgi:hypothetical protein
VPLNTKLKVSISHLKTSKSYATPELDNLVTVIEAEIYIIMVADMIIVNFLFDKIVRTEIPVTIREVSFPHEKINATEMLSHDLRNIWQVFINPLDSIIMNAVNVRSSCDEQDFPSTPVGHLSNFMVAKQV